MMLLSLFFYAGIDATHKQCLPYQKFRKQHIGSTTFHKNLTENEPFGYSSSIQALWTANSRAKS